MADFDPAQQLAFNKLVAQMRDQLSDPQGAAEVVASVGLGSLVQLAGLDELADGDELLGWLMSTATAIRDNPDLREQMRARGAEVSAEAQRLFKQAQG